MCIKDPPSWTIGPELIVSGAEYVLFVNVETLCCPSSLLNYMTVIPVGIAISCGTKEDLPCELKGIETSYAG